MRLCDLQNTRGLKSAISRPINERTKEKYASNPDVDASRSKYNFHLVKPPGKYRAESERQIAAAGCRTRKDSIRMIETLFTASPEFFKGKKRAEIRVFFEEALHFLEQHQSKETIISAVVHMDEKTPHMHLCLSPLTDGWQAQRQRHHGQ